MKTIETFIEGKKEDINECEDGYVFTDDYVVVIDGATAKTDKKYDGVSSGKYMKDLVKEKVKEMDQGLGKEEFIRELESKVREHYKLKGWLESIKNTVSDRPTATLAIYSHSKKEVWLCGDALALTTNGEEYDVFTNEKKIDKVTSEARKLINESVIYQGNTRESLQEKDIGREYIKPMLSKQQIFQNNKDFDSDLNYAVLDGFECDLNKVKTIKIKDNVKEVILASDGYVTLLPTLEETELRLKEDIEEDPLCLGILLSTKGLEKGNKSFDDRTYVRIGI